MYKLEMYNSTTKKWEIYTENRNINHLKWIIKTAKYIKFRILELWYIIYEGEYSCETKNEWMAFAIQEGLNRDSGMNTEVKEEWRVVK